MVPGVGDLPTGLAISAAGVISGTPTATGSTFTVQVSDGVQTAQKSLTITINGASDDHDGLPAEWRARHAVFADADGDGRDRLEYVVAGVRFLAGGIGTLGGRSDQRDAYGERDRRSRCR